MFRLSCAQVLLLAFAVAVRAQPPATDSGGAPADAKAQKNGTPQQRLEGTWVVQSPAALAEKEPLPPPKHKTTYASEYYHAFKGDEVIGEEFHWHGVDTQQCVFFEPAGMRINLPAGYPGKRPGTGIGINMPVQGDFEITMNYEMLKEPPEADTRNAQGMTGLFLWVDLNLPKLNRGHVIRGIWRDKQYVSWYHLTRPEPAQPVDVSRRFPAEGVRGQLRLIRTGPVLYHYAAEGARKEFRLLTQHEFGVTDLEAVHWGGTTGGPETFLEGRILDIRIRADGLPTLAAPAVPVVAAAQESLHLGSGYLLFFVAGLAAALLGAVCGGGVIVWTVRRRRAAANATPVPFPCSGCGRNLYVQPAFAGKKVKCKECGAAVRVPVN